MNEETKGQTEKEEEESTKQSPESDSDKGDKPKSFTLYERTNEATERLEKANAKTEEILNRQEEIYQKQKLGGGSEAGQPSEKKEETAQEYVKREFAWMK